MPAAAVLATVSCASPITGAAERVPAQHRTEDGRALAPGLARLGEADLSFDGTRFLFTASRNGDEPLAVWEMSTNGAGLRRVIALPDRDITRALYAPTLYTLEAAGPTPRIAFIAAARDADARGYGVLHTCGLDGGDVRRIGYNPYGERDPRMLPNGRIMVQAAEAEGPPRLLELFPDGTGVALAQSPPERPSDPLAGAARLAPAGHSSVVDERVHRGHLYCLDSRIGAPRAAGRVQVWTTAPPGVGPPAPVTEQLLGVAPVEPDGSFALEVPAPCALRLVLLDEADTVLARCAWIWVMPNENRGCVGCHENPRLAPPNRRVAALRQKPHRLTLPDAPEQPE